MRFMRKSIEQIKFSKPIFTGFSPGQYHLDELNALLSVQIKYLKLEEHPLKELYCITDSIPQSKGDKENEQL